MAGSRSLRWACERVCAEHGVCACVRACGRSVPVIGSRGNSAFGRRLAGVCGHRTRAESGTLDALAPSGSWETVFSCSRGHKEQTMRHADSQGSKISAGPAGHEHEGWVRSKRALCDMSFARFGSLRSYSGGVLDGCTLIFGSRRSLPDHQPCSTATPRVLRYGSLQYRAFHPSTMLPPAAAILQLASDISRARRQQMSRGDAANLISLC